MRHHPLHHWIDFGSVVRMGKAYIPGTVHNLPDPLPNVLLS